LVWRRVDIIIIILWFEAWFEVVRDPELDPPTAATPSTKTRGAGSKLATPVYTKGSHLSAQPSNATKKGNDCSLLQEWFDPWGADGLGEIIDTAMVSPSGPSKLSITPLALIVDREQAMVAPSGPSKFSVTPPAFMIDLANGRKVERNTGNEIDSYRFPIRTHKVVLGD
jgi:hypothetical protein